MMPLLADIYSAADAFKRNLKDIAQDPLAVAERQIQALRNNLLGREAVINDQGAGMQQLSPEEHTRRMTEASLDSISGGLGGVIKPKGGNWVNGAIEEEIRALRGPSALMDDATNKWVDNQLTNYIKNQMGTEDDPIRKLAEQGITHVEPTGRLAKLDRPLTEARKEAGFPPKGISKTPMGKDWEKRADSPIAFADAKEAYQRLLDNEGKFVWMGKYGDPLFPMANSMAESVGARARPFAEDLADVAKKEYGWADKVPEGTQIYGFDRNLVNPLANFGQLDKLIKVTSDAIRSGKLTPQQIASGSHSVENAVRMADVLRKEKLAKLNSPDVHMNLPDLEQSIVRLNRPGQFANESDTMGHSVRGYEPDSHMPFYGHGGWKGIESGKAEVYSVRNKSGKPGATIEVIKHPDGTRAVTQIKGKFNRKVDPEFQPAIIKFLNEGNFLREEANTGKYGMDKSGIFSMANGDYITKDELAKRVSAGDPDAMDVWQWYVIGD